jgi:hypothetical protein
VKVGNEAPIGAICAKIDGIAIFMGLPGDGPGHILGWWISSILMGANRGMARAFGAGGQTWVRH